MRAPDADHDAAVSAGDGNHALSRHPRAQQSGNRNNRGNGRRRRLGRNAFGGHGLHRGHQGLLHGLTSLLGLILGLFKHHKHTGRGRSAHAAKGRKHKITRARAVEGIRRPHVRHHRVSRGRHQVVGRHSRRHSLYISTGVFDVRTGKLKKMRLLG